MFNFIDVDLRDHVEVEPVTVMALGFTLFLERINIIQVLLPSHRLRTLSSSKMELKLVKRKRIALLLEQHKEEPHSMQSPKTISKVN